MSAWPLNFLRTQGPAGDPVTTLQWGLLTISIVVIVIIAALLLFGCLRRRSPLPAEATGAERQGLRWIVVGTVITIPVLLASLVWTFITLRQVIAAPDPALIVDVIAHRWWWEFRYRDRNAQLQFITANEIHIPVGKPVRFNLRSADVIHSFWVPRLGGKTDVIPGQTNIAWLQANKAGHYRGQCGEYCGAQHAHMGLYIVADSQDKFDRWRKNQQTTALAPAQDQTRRGRDLFVTSCGSCHSIKGTTAGGDAAPDLTHLMSRETLAATLLPLNRGSLGGWIANPQALKPGALMPASSLDPADLQAMLAYLHTLD